MYTQPKQVIATGGSRTKVIELLIKITRDPSQIFAIPQTEDIRTEESDRVIERDLGWQITTRGNTDPIGRLFILRLDVNGQDVGILLSYFAYKHEGLPTMNKFMDQLFNAMKENGIKLHKIIGDQIPTSLSQTVIEFQQMTAHEWHTLMRPSKMRANVYSDESVLNPDDIVGKYGTNRDLSKNEVRNIVKRCREFILSGGTIETFYQNVPGINKPFSLGTLRDWMKDPKFK